MRVHARAMYKVAVAIVRDSALAEDVVQEAVVRAWENLHTFRGDGPVRGWMLRITHNVAVSELRRSREQAWDPEKLSAVAVAAAGPERRVASASELDSVLLAIDDLDELSRSILALRVSEELSYQQIADTLGITLGQVKIRLLRARRALAVGVEREAQ